MRIVSLTPSATEIVAALGLADRLVGVSHVCDHPPMVADLPRVTGTSVAADASSRAIDRQVKEVAGAGGSLYRLDGALLAELQPDLVLTQGVCDVCAVGEAQAVAGLDALDPAPEIVSLHPHRLDDVLDDIRRVGRAAGAEADAEALAGRAADRIAAVEARVAGRPPVGVVVLEWVDPLFSADHWTPDVVAAAGGRELLAEPGARSRELAWSEVRAAGPEVLVVACCGQDVPRSLEDMDRLRERPGYDELRAVRDGRVYIGDGGAHFSRPGPRLIDSIELLAETLHPTGSGTGLVPADRLSS